MEMNYCVFSFSFWTILPGLVVVDDQETKWFVFWKSFHMCCLIFQLLLLCFDLYVSLLTMYNFYYWDFWFSTVFSTVINIFYMFINDAISSFVSNISVYTSLKLTWQKDNRNHAKSIKIIPNDTFRQCTVWWTKSICNWHNNILSFGDAKSPGANHSKMHFISLGMDLCCK